MGAVKFDDLEYTRESLVKQLLLVQNHGVDGSAVDAGCGCIEDKHLLVIEALSEEGETIATDPKEKEFYAQLSDLSRILRKKIDTGDFSMHGVMQAVMQKQASHAVAKVWANIYPKGTKPTGTQACVRCMEVHSKAECVEIGACAH